MLIGLMFLKNQVVYIQFHPVAYMVKLNIEMSMASLVVRLAQGKPDNDMYPHDIGQSSTGPHASSDHRSKQLSSRPAHDHLQSFQLTSVKGDGMNGLTHKKNSSDSSLGGIHCRTDVHVMSHDRKDDADLGERASSRSSGEAPRSMFEDDTPLNKSGVRITERAV
jgi:hypothetical protein